MERTEELQLTRPNMRVITFLQEPAIQLEPQGVQVLNAIKQGSPILRCRLVIDLAPVIVSKRKITDVVAYYVGYLRKLGCIKVDEFDDWKAQNSPN